MDLKELLSLLDKVAKDNSLSKPYLVGGFPRDVYMKTLQKISDIDVTCGDQGSKIFAIKMSEALPGSKLQRYNDGHSKLVFGKYKIDFSSNFKIPDIKSILIKSNISNPKPMQEELYSRDFTVNTLLMPLDLSFITDLTGLAMKDIKEKKLDTCLSPRITFSYDPKRIIRVVYLSAKLGFYPAERVIDWIRKNKNIVKQVNEGFIRTKLIKALETDSQATNKMINVLNIKDSIPNIKGIF